MLKEKKRHWGQWWGGVRGEGGSWSFFQTRLISWTNHISSTSFTYTPRNDGVMPRARPSVVMRWYAALINSGWPSADPTMKSWRFGLSEQKRSSSGGRVIRHSAEIMNGSGWVWLQYFTCGNWQTCHYKLILHPDYLVKKMTLWFND